MAGSTTQFPGAAVLQKAGLLEGELDLLAGVERSVAFDLDIGEVDKTIASQLGCGDHSPPLVGIEPLDDAG
jgi:hypothetical protein